MQPGSGIGDASAADIGLINSHWKFTPEIHTGSFAALFSFCMFELPLFGPFVCAAISAMRNRLVVPDSPNGIPAAMAT
jgi:hypothetical protein